MLVFVYAVNGARGFAAGFWQLLVILSVMNLIDRFLIDGCWGGHTKAWTIPGTEDLKPYIPAEAKRKKWLFGTLGMAVIAAVLAGIMCIFVRRDEADMKENYILAAFRKTAAQQFPERRTELNEKLAARMAALRAEHADAPKPVQFHLESQILPGIAAYEVLRTVHGYVEARAWKMKQSMQKLLRLPGLYRLAPVLFCKLTPKYFGETAGFAATEYQTSGGVWRIDMTKCPYHDTCVQHGCPELCPCFCDSDDVTYDGLHPKLRWHRTKTLGRGDDCCDFYLGITE